MSIEQTLTPLKYNEFVRSRAKDGDDILDEMTGPDAHRLHMAVGVAGEAGELLDAIKKNVVYRKPLDRMNVIEELGDLEFFMEGLRDSLGITRQETLEHNVAKLTKRYRAGYSNSAAQQRADKQ